MSKELARSDDVLADLCSDTVWHEAALDITAYLDELKDTLWSELNQKQLDGRQGTLCWVLTWLDCSGHFREVFKIALTGGYEAQCHALRLLRNQFAEVSSEELNAAQAMMPLVDQVTTCEPESRDVLRRELQEIIDRRWRAGAVEPDLDE